MTKRQQNFLDDPPPGIVRGTELAIKRGGRRRPTLRRQVERQIERPVSPERRFELANGELLQQRCCL